MADYDAFADKYDQTVQLMPYRFYIEAYSMFKLIGSVEGLDVLDVACGTGLYTREARRRGARRAFGVDLSEQMIRVARAAEAEQPLGVEYAAQDVGDLNESEQFDLAIGAYLLHYATDRDHLHRMCQSISNHLRPGSRFVTYQLNPDASREPDYYLRYGLHIPPHSARSDGDSFTFTVKTPEFQGPFMTVYYWSHVALEGALRAAGFSQIRWTMPEVSEEGRRQYGSEMWEPYLRQPHCVIIDCVKA